MTEPIEPLAEIGVNHGSAAGSNVDPLRDGAQVTVYRLAMIQRPITEGTATILSAFDETRDLYWVRFAGESVPRVRLVHAGSWQSEPDATLAALLAHWRDDHRLEALGPFLSDDGPMSGEGQ